MLVDLYYFGDDERGAAAIEYGLIAALVSVAGVIALGLAGESLRDLLTLVANALGAGS
jgi:pilus assembly protein Flp/PilA